MPGEFRLFLIKTHEIPGEFRLFLIKTHEMLGEFQLFLIKTHEMPGEFQLFLIKTHEMPGVFRLFLIKTHEIPGQFRLFFDKNARDMGVTRGCWTVGIGGYLPIQKCLNILPSTSLGVIWPPVISANWLRHTLKSSLIRSPLIPVLRASMTRIIISSARVSAS